MQNRAFSIFSLVKFAAKFRGVGEANGIYYVAVNRINTSMQAFELKGLLKGPSGGMVDAGDSKSPALTGVPVRVRPWVPLLSFKTVARRTGFAKVLRVSFFGEGSVL